MASEPEMSEPSFLEQLISTRNRDLSMFLPLILGFTSRSPRREPDDPDQETEDQTTGDERIILINPFTQGMIVIEGSRSLEALLREVSNKDGPRPATKASIEAMAMVEITEGDGGDGECAICLEEWEIGGEAKEMPCKHRYHCNCIEKWLGIHGSCPVCRFKMPVDEDDSKKIGGSDGGDEEGRRRREIWVSFSLNGNNGRNSNSDSATDSDDSSSNPRPDSVDGSSTTEMDN
ncbi:hypothetical protein HHK36_024711 [Tetracentron sinense]|uniref:RING-type E3 ubiquitin transferase n=1 Tax=Tetracentron sinense TaxID=13715 RepID=A0A834YJU9_TETSI|nr:hypothetical protein HHK36_024711 [Tetracentron sinense]